MLLATGLLDSSIIGLIKRKTEVSVMGLAFPK